MIIILPGDFTKKQSKPRGTKKKKLRYQAKQPNIPAHKSSRSCRKHLFTAENRHYALCVTTRSKPGWARWTIALEILCVYSAQIHTRILLYLQPWLKAPQRYHCLRHDQTHADIEQGALARLSWEREWVNECEWVKACLSKWASEWMHILRDGRVNA